MLTTTPVRPHIIYTDNEWTLAPWQQLDDEILDTDMLQLGKKNATNIMPNFQQQMKRYTEYEGNIPMVPKPTVEPTYRRSVKRLPNQASVYSAKAHAIYDAGKERCADCVRKATHPDGQPEYHPSDKKPQQTVID
jgi:hypothetical protein